MPWRIMTQDGGWVRVTDLGQAVSERRTAGEALKWLVQARRGFVVAKRRFAGKGNGRALREAPRTGEPSEEG